MVLKNVLVTGGTGSIGKFVVKSLVQRGYYVKVLTRTYHPNTPNIKYIKGDINDQVLLKENLKDCPYIIHLAACISGDKSKDEFYNTNVLGTKTLLESVNKKIIKKIIYISTVSIFKDCGHKIRDEKWLKNTKSENLYIKSKLEAYYLVHKLMKNLPITILFPSTVVNIKERVNPGKGFSSILWKLFGSVPGAIINKIGDQNRYINYILVDDLTIGIIDTLKKAKTSEEYLLTGENLSVKNFSRKMGIIYHQKLLPISIPLSLIKFLIKIPISWPNIIKIISKEGLSNVYFSSEKAQKDFNFKYHQL